MKVNELKVGNYFDLYGSVAKLHPSDFNKWCKDFQFRDFRPIPITEEWLLKLGFEYYKPLDHYKIVINDVWYSIKSKHNFDGFWFTFVNLNLDETKEMPYKKVEFVHQLQNLFFTLADQELTIKR